MRWKGGVGLLLAAAACGCATVSDFADQSQKANLAIEQSSNSTLLLNVVRAYQRRPMHFTAIQSVKTPIGVGAPSFALGLPALGADRDMLSRKFYAPSMTYKVDVPNFDVAVWDGQEFMRGITTSVDAKTFAYYLDQGWPLQMVVHLLVREIRLLGSDNSTVVQRYVNYPGNAGDFAEFQRAVDTFANCELRVLPGDPVKFGPEITSETLAKATPLEGIAAIKEQGLAIVTNDSESAYRVVNKNVPVKVLFADHFQKDDMCRPLGMPTRELASLHMGAGMRAPSAPGKPAVQFYMRSPEAVIYYLGEIARAQLGDPLRSGRVSPHPAQVKTVTDSQSLFVLRKGAVPEGVKPAVRAEYDGVNYWIPGDPEGGRSMHALSLVQLIVNSQKNSKDLPATTTIRLQVP